MSSSVVEHIRTASELRALDADQLADLAEDIRARIVAAVEEHGGHLGSNLGAVELTIALHRVLDSPRDILLWDTGHQTYPHKILTGRADGFARLRQEGGLSGYPSRAESEHDWIENSHASTVLSYAHGLATAQASAVGEGRRVVAVIGDGALTGGMAYEGLNNLGSSGADCIVILNDNGRSYAPTVSRLSACVQGRLQRVDGQDVVDLRDTPGEGAHFFEALGLEYHGPYDGHDVAAVEAALRAACTRRGPQVLHVLTQKGRGHAAAEADTVKCLHDTSVAKPDSFTVAFSRTLLDLVAEEPRLVALTAAMPDSTGLLELGERFGDRLVDVGIAEQHAVTAAAGMAMGGLVPIVAVYATFLTRAIDQVIYDVGLHRLPVIFCLDRAGITGDDGASHHGVLDLALLSRVPGITIFAPSALDELPVMLREAVAIATGPTPGPVAIRWPKTTPPASNGGTGQGTAARRLRVGQDVCLVGIGKGLEAALGAADELASYGIDATVWDPRCVRPLDHVLVRDAAAHRLVVTIEDGVREGGIGATLADRVASLVGDPRRAPRLEVLGTPTAYLPHAKPDELHRSLGLDGPSVAALVLDRLDTPAYEHLGVTA